MHPGPATLEAKGWSSDRRLRVLIGDETRHLGTRYRLKELPRVAEPIMDLCTGRPGGVRHLPLSQDDAMVVVASIHSSERLRTVTTFGTRDLLHASALGRRTCPRCRT